MSELNISKITDEDLYIDENQKDDRVEDSLTNLSWVNIVEDELRGSIDEKVLAGSLIEEVEEDKLTDIDEILKLNCENISDLNLLEYQTFISGNLRKLLKNQNIDTSVTVDEILIKLIWLMEGSEKLCNKLSLDLFLHKKSDIKPNSIPRSSYKFCNFNIAKNRVTEIFSIPKTAKMGGTRAVPTKKESAFHCLPAIFLCISFPFLASLAHYNY